MKALSLALGALAYLGLMFSMMTLWFLVDALTN
jgi:hypothetical protein